MTSVRVSANLARLLSAGAILLPCLGAAWAQTPAPAKPPAKTATQGWEAPSPPADLVAARQKVDAGAPEDLIALANSGRADAQVDAGTLYIFGRGKIARDTPRGCGFVAKAAATRPDAMYLLGQCQQLGLTGPADLTAAKASYERAIAAGYIKAKCTLGVLLMAEASTAQRGLTLCKEVAQGGDLQAQMTVGAAYLKGDPIPKDAKEARKWYEMAAKQAPGQAGRKLGELYANGEGGKADPKKAMAQWVAAEKAGDVLTCILIADQMYSELTGGRKPGPGTYAFKGGVPTADIEVVESWYQAALERDPRPEVKERSKYALSILKSLKSVSATTKKPKKS